MCGIAGSFGPIEPDRESIARTLKLMSNRGPDAHGCRKLTVRGQPLALLHSRLSIIDLDERANQPFAADGCVLSFNGEIFNFVELRRELEALGHKFATQSDTEVIIKAYRHFGDGFVDRMEGMWAFALVDERKQVLILSRDRFGEKPLYYAEWGGVLYFASEAKALAALANRIPSPDHEQVRRYLVNGYKALYKSPRTYFTDIHEFPAASYAIISTPQMATPIRYWRLEYAPQAISRSDALAEVRERLMRAVEIRMRADVPIAFCLSGGVDSTALALIANKQFGRDISTFSIIDQDQRYDESENLEVTVSELGCSHEFIETSTDHFLDGMRDLVAYHDAPVATISYYVHAFLSEAISKAGFKVAISGTGADELFTGYYDHYGYWLASQSARPDFDDLIMDWRESLGAFVQNPLLQDPRAFAKNPGQRGHIYLNSEHFSALLRDPFEEVFAETRYSGDLLRNRMLNEIHHEAIPVLLREDDLNSMRWSVENRSPFLDRSLSEFLFTVPNEHLIDRGYTKSLLRDAVADLTQTDVIWDKRKRGFNASIDSVLDRNDPDTIECLLAPGPIFDIVDRNAMEGLLTKDMTDNSYSKFLFSFVSSKMFLESDLFKFSQPHGDLAPEAQTS